MGSRIILPPPAQPPGPRMGPPIYSPSSYERRKVQGGNVQLPDPQQIKLMLAHLADPFLLFINIFDESLAAFQSDEDSFNAQYDFWWCGATASFSGGGGASTASVQIQHVITDPQGNIASSRHEQTPINFGNHLGTGQKQFSLKSPKLFRAGTAVICRVQNLQNAANVIQVVLFGYIDAALTRRGG